MPGEKRGVWFERSDEFYAELRTRFGDEHDRASAGECDHWTEMPKVTGINRVVGSIFPQSLPRRRTHLRDGPQGVGAR